MWMEGGLSICCCSAAAQLGQANKRKRDLNRRVLPIFNESLFFLSFHSSFYSRLVRLLCCCVQKRREEEENKLRIKRQAEEAARARQNAAKREKENAKRALKREREQLHKYGKQFNYFTGAPPTASAASPTTTAQDEAELVKRMADLDRLCELLTIDE